MKFGPFPHPPPAPHRQRDSLWLSVMLPKHRVEDDFPSHSFPIRAGGARGMGCPHCKALRLQAAHVLLWWEEMSFWITEEQAVSYRSPLLQKGNLPSWHHWKQFKGSPPSPCQFYRRFCTSTISDGFQELGKLSKGLARHFWAPHFYRAATLFVALWSSQENCIQAAEYYCLPHNVPIYWGMVFNHLGKCLWHVGWTCNLKLAERVPKMNSRHIKHETHALYTFDIFSEFLLLSVG